MTAARPGWARHDLWLIALVLVATAGLGAWQGWQWLSTLQAGLELFDGRRPLVARVQGHADRLPAAAARCSNCHAPQSVRQGARAAGLATTSFGPLLNRASLQHNLPRRGGPPSRYDAHSLCQVLRTGVDPAWVVLPRTMPRYELSGEDCAALWAHLTRR
jgi:cytochrome c553